MRSHKESQSILRAALRAHGLRKHLRPRPSRSRVLPGTVRYQDRIVLIRKRWLLKCYQIYPWYVSCSSLRSVLQSFWIQSQSDLNTVAKKASIVHTVTLLNCPSHTSCKKSTQNWPCLFSAVIKFKVGHSRIQSFQTGIAPFIDSLNTSGVKKIPRNPDFLRKESYYSSLDVVCWFFAMHFSFDAVVSCRIWRLDFQRFKENIQKVRGCIPARLWIQTQDSSFA